MVIKGEEKNGYDKLSWSLRKELLATAECVRKEGEDPVRGSLRLSMKKEVLLTFQ